MWGTRTGFILAAIGSAIGLGNIWRFPYMAYENGGAAFLIPYFFALITAGIPILILEFYIGHRMRTSVPSAFEKLGKFGWLGWWQIVISFVVSTYYSVIIAWALLYSFFAVTKSWGSQPEDYLMNDFLGITNTETWSSNFLGGFQWHILIALAVVWGLAFIILHGGVRKGIERANKIFMPMLFAIILLILFRSVTLEGAAVGLNALFSPEWGQILNSSTWISAYTQIFFSLGIGLGAMITYASYLPKKSDITNNAFMTALANCGFSLLAGISVFGALGFIAQQKGMPLDEVATGGVILAFSVFPEIINAMPMGNIIGVLFFVSLLFAGISSLVSMAEPFISALGDKFNIKRKHAVNWTLGSTALISILFATGSGLHLLDSIDRSVAVLSLSITGLMMVVMMSWKLRLIPTARHYVNEVSDFSLGRWWSVCLVVLTPLVLGYNAIMTLIGDIQHNYEGYPNSLIYTSWIVAIAILFVALCFHFMKRSEAK